MTPQPFCSFAVSSLPEGKAGIADVDLAGPARTKELLRAQSPRRPDDGSPAADAAEYVKLAVKRWRYYLAEGVSPLSLEDAKRRIAADPQCELGFLLAARVRGTAHSEAGFCFLRRVWTGRFVVDFPAVHPRTFNTVTGVPAITGIGAGILAAAAKLTLALNGTGFWGEATKNSHGFYQRMKGKVRRETGDAPITDHFRFEGEELQVLADEFLIQKNT